MEHAIARDRAPRTSKAGRSRCASTLADPASGTARRNTKVCHFRCPDEAIAAASTKPARRALATLTMWSPRRAKSPTSPVPAHAWNASPADATARRARTKTDQKQPPIIRRDRPYTFNGIDIMRAVRMFPTLTCRACGTFTASVKENAGGSHVPMFARSHNVPAGIA